MKIREILFENRKWLFENINQTPPRFLLIYFYFSLDLVVRLMRKEAENNTAPLISGQDGPCRKLRLKLISPYILVAIN